MRREIVPFGGFLLTLMGGISYTWGVFVLPLVERFGWTTAEATFPVTVFLGVYAISMVPAGRLQDKLGPRKVAIMGAVAYFLAYALASLVDRFPYPWWLLVTYGLLGGIGTGLTYACAYPTARKWFPDKPGRAVGFALTGFGLAALFFAPLIAKYLIPVYGIEGTLLILGVITGSVCIFAAFIVKNPPEGWAPSGWKPDESAQKKMMIRQESTAREMMRSSQFWVMWPAFALVISGPLMAMGLIPAYGELIVGLTPEAAALAMSVFAVFNGFGRPVAGVSADRWGVVRVMATTYIFVAIVFLVFPAFAVTLPTLYISAAVFGWGFAVTLALFPTLTSLSFGVKNLGFNYAIVFLAYGLATLAPAAGAWVYDVTGTYTWVFISAGILCGIGAVLCIIMKKKYALP